MHWNKIRIFHFFNYPYVNLLIIFVYGNWWISEENVSYSKYKQTLSEYHTKFGFHWKPILKRKKISILNSRTIGSSTKVNAVPVLNGKSKWKSRWTNRPTSDWSCWVWKAGILTAWCDARFSSIDFAKSHNSLYPLPRLRAEIPLFSY